MGLRARTGPVPARVPLISRAVHPAYRVSAFGLPGGLLPELHRIPAETQPVDAAKVALGWDSGSKKGGRRRQIVGAPACLLRSV